jgi:hypothetical protein
MKKHILLLSLLFLLLQAAAQPLNVKNKSFAETFLLLYKSAGNYFKEVKGVPIVSTMFAEPDTIGYRLRLLPAGVTDWKHISVDMNYTLTIFFKLGEYSKDSAEVAKRFNDIIALIKEADPTATLQEDDSYSDTKIKEINICTVGAKSCGEEDKWRVSLYFHKMFDDEYNVSVNMQSFKE